MSDKNLVLVCGETGTGKSTCLMPLKDNNRVMYLNCEAGKRLPFKNKFQNYIIQDPYQVYEAFDHVENTDCADIVVIDTITYLLDMYETQHVLTATDTRAAWGNFAQYFKKLMQEYVKNCSKTVIILGHTLTLYDEKNLSLVTSVPVKGALKNQGIESYFSCVVGTKKVPLKELEKYQNDLLDITEDDELLGFKYVFQTRLTKKTVNERLRSPIGMWLPQETFIDNNILHLLQRLKEYYED